MHQSSDARSSYLALALASRKALRTLDEYIDGTANFQSLELQKIVREVIESLVATKRTRDAKNLFGPVPKSSPFSNYEQLLTLEEAESDLEDQDVVGNLEKLLAPDTTQDVRRQNATEAIRFFYALENRALHHYSRQVGYREP
jgi:hypothetical protein